MKKKIVKRAKRVKNGTTYWKLTKMNNKTGKSTTSKFKGTYDEITAKLNRLRSHNHDTAFCAEEMDKRGKNILEDGKVLTLDSVEDEKMFLETVNPTKVNPLEGDEFDFPDENLFN